jgi:hypothetical protein
MPDFELIGKKDMAKIRFSLVLWNRFVKDKTVKGFPALAFVCWCHKNTPVKSSTIKDYLSALRKIKFLLGFLSKKGSKMIEKNFLERNGKY